MAITFVGAGAVVSAGTTSTTTTTVSTTAAVPLPTNTAAGDRVFICVVNAPATFTPATPTGWTQLSTVSVGTGTLGAGTGPRRITIFWRDYATTWTMPTVATTGAAGSISASAVSYRKGANETWSTAVTSGSDTTTDTAFSVTGAANLSLTTGKHIFVVGATSDNVTATLVSLTAAGATIGSVAEVADGGTATGNDVGITVYTGAVTAGSSTAAPVHSLTLSGASDGGVLFVALTAADTVAPTVPSNVTATGTSATRVTISWSASTDNTAVASYRVKRGGVDLAAATAVVGTSFVDSTVSANTAYSYTVSSVDAAGNRSAESTAATVTTPRAVDPTNLWKGPQQVDSQLASRPELQPLADQPAAKWINNQTDANNIPSFVTSAAGKTLILCIYAIPGRDSGNYSAGGFPDRASYLSFITSIKNNLGSAPAIISFEPDALGLTPGMTATNKAERIETLRQAVNILSTIPNSETYIDASQWISITEQATLLQSVDVHLISGITINTSGYESQDSCYSYGNGVVAELSARSIPGKKFIVDSSRNGVGPLTQADRPLADPWFNTNQAWCNPPTRRIGPVPGLVANQANCRATLWVKAPGESDGTFPTLNDSTYFGESAPSAGQFWVPAARMLLGLSPQAAPAAGTTVSSVVASFDDGTYGSFTTQYGASLVGGRARVPVGVNTYQSIQTPYTYTLQGGSIFARIYPAAANEATSADMVTTDLLINSSTDGTRIVARVDTAKNVLYLGSESGYYDPAGINISPYDPVNHAWVRIRESGGTVYWDTSADGTTWTQRKSAAKPSWVTTTPNSQVQLIGNRSVGTPNYCEFDNVNVTAGVVSVKARVNGSWSMLRNRAASGWGSTPKTRVNGVWL